MRAFLAQPAAKIFLSLVCLIPLSRLVYLTFSDGLGANPAEYLIRATGDWTLRFLCLTLAITPLRVISAWPEWVRFRRSLGLFTFFYACLHACSYTVFDMGLEWADIGRDILKRPFIAVGFSAWLLLWLLAATSFNRAVKWLGAKRWQALHRAVSGIAGLAVLHFFWMRASKQNFAEVAVYAAVLALLLGWRVVRALRQWPAKRMARVL